MQLQYALKLGRKHKFLSYKFVSLHLIHICIHTCTNVYNCKFYFSVESYANTRDSQEWEWTKPFFTIKCWQKLSMTSISTMQMSFGNASKWQTTKCFLTLQTVTCMGTLSVPFTLQESYSLMLGKWMTGI